MANPYESPEHVNEPESPRRSRWLYWTIAAVLLAVVAVVVVSLMPSSTIPQP